MYRKYLISLTALLLIASIYLLPSLKTPSLVTIQPHNQLAQVSSSLTDGLVGWWKFDEGSGTIATDSSGNGNTGTLTNRPAFTYGKIGQAIYFDGTNGISVPNSSILSGMNNLTVSLWIKLTNTDVNQYVLVKGNTIAPWTSYYIYIDTNGKPNFSVKTDSGNAMLYGSTPLQINEWYQVVGVYNGTNLAMYINGQKDNRSPALTGRVFASNDTLIISGGAGAKVNGLIDDVRLYNRALSANDINEMFTLSATNVVVQNENNQTQNNNQIVNQVENDVGNSVSNTNILNTVNANEGSVSTDNVISDLSKTAVQDSINEITLSSRLIDWSVAGVPGGIPNRTEICSTISPSPINPQSTTGTISANSNTLMLSDVKDFRVGQGIKIVGAAFKKWTTEPGADLYTTIKSVNGNNLVLSVPAQISVNNAVVTHDDVSAIQDAVNSCPNNQVVYIKAGTYNLERTISSLRGGFTIRGDGQGKTIFNQKTGTAFTFGSSDWPPPTLTVPIVSGAIKNSTTITVDTIAKNSAHSAFEVGKLIKIGAGVNPSFVHNIGVSSYDNQLSVTVLVTAVSGNTVSFTPSLPFDFTQYSPMVGLYSIKPPKGIGLEGFTIDMMGTGLYGITFIQLWGSWIQDIEIKNSSHHILSLYAVQQSEVRHNYFHDTITAGPNTEGIDFYRDSCWNRIEDNVVYNVGGIVIGDWQGGSAGNVIGYNFAYATASGVADVAQADILLNHGSNNMFNLVEGNVAGGVLADNYFGSVSHNVILRNWITATHPTATNNLRAIRLKHFSTYFTILGNVLGSSVFPTSGSVNLKTARGGFLDAPMLSGYDNGASSRVQIIYELGFPNIGNTGFIGTIPVSDPIDYSSQGSTLATAQAFDLNVDATLIRHGNYDFYTKSIKWNPNISDHSIPTSLAYKSKPAFFGNHAWPAVDPSNPRESFDIIPAGYRYMHKDDSNPYDSVPPPPSVILGDFNNDNYINSLDISILFSNWNTQSTTCDLNKDGIVNSLDYVIVVKNWTV